MDSKVPKMFLCSLELTCFGCCQRAFFGVSERHRGVLWPGAESENPGSVLESKFPIRGHTRQTSVEGEGHFVSLSLCLTHTP